MTIWKHHTEVDMDNHKITSVADSTAAQDAATKNYVDVRLPTGSITMWGTDTAPPGWHLCNGASLLRAGTYADLFGIIGTAFGTADGTHFNVPDMRQRFPLGVAAAGTGNALAGTGGAIDHTHTTSTHSLTTAELATHTHVQNAHDHDIERTTDNGSTYTNAAIGRDGAITSSIYLGTQKGVAAFSGWKARIKVETATNKNTGSGTAHSHGATGTNNAPFMALNFIIKF